MEEICENNVTWGNETELDMEDPLRIDEATERPLVQNCNLQVRDEPPINSSIMMNFIKVEVTEMNGTGKDKKAISSQPVSNSQFSHSEVVGMNNADEAKCCKNGGNCNICNRPYAFTRQGSLYIKGVCKNCFDGSLNKNVQPEVALISYDSNIIDVKSLICMYCTEVFSTVELFDKHLALRNTLKYECKQCANVFCDKNYLMKHSALHTTEDQESVEAIISGKGDDNETSVEGDRKPSTNKPEIVTPNVKKSKICHICNKQCRSLCGLDSHLKMHKKQALSKTSSLKSCSICHKLISAYGFVSHMKSHKKSSKSKKRLNKRCSICHKLINAYGFVSHMKSHRNKKHEKSSKSTKTSSSKTDLNEPVNDWSMEKRSKRIRSLADVKTSSRYSNDVEVSTNPTSVSLVSFKFLCKVCNEEFANLDLSLKHLEDDSHINNIVKIAGANVVCKLCENVFSNINDFRSHVIKKEHLISYNIEMHNKDVSFCHDCNICFSDSSGLKAHIFLYHDDIKEICKESYVQLKAPVVNLVELCAKKGKGNDVSLPADFKVHQPSIDKYLAADFWKKKPVYNLLPINRETSNNNSDKTFGKDSNSLLVTPDSSQCVCKCKKVFENEQRLKIHKLTCHLGGMKVCNKCNMRFSNQKDLVLHSVDNKHNITRIMFSMVCSCSNSRFTTVVQMLRHFSTKRHVADQVRQVIMNSFCKLCNESLQGSAHKHVQKAKHCNAFIKYLFDKNVIVTKKHPKLLKNRKMRSTK